MLSPHACIDEEELKKDTFYCEAIERLGYLCRDIKQTTLKDIYRGSKMRGNVAVCAKANALDEHCSVKGCLAGQEMDLHREDRVA